MSEIVKVRKSVYYSFNGRRVYFNSLHKKWFGEKLMIRFGEWGHWYDRGFENKKEAFNWLHEATPLFSSQ